MDFQLTPKLWGSELELVNNESYCGKVLTLDPGYQCSLHYHPMKKETFCVLEGQVLMEIYSPKGYVGHEYRRSNQLIFGHFSMNPGDRVTIEPNTPHRFRALKGNRAMIMEISTPHSDDDVVRIEPSRAIEIYNA